MGGQRWKVVADGIGYGVAVRHGKDPSSHTFADPLPPGAVVEQLDFADDCLHFKRLSGVGPMSGWVSVRADSRELLVRVKAAAAPSPRSEPAAAEARPPLAAAPRPASSAPAPSSGQRWCVVRCSDQGLVVRQGRSLASQELPQRLPLGAVLEQRELSGDRLHFVLLSSTGPSSGWVSIRHMGRDFVMPQGMLVSAAADALASDERSDHGAQVGSDHPLGGWAKLAANYGRAPQLLLAAATDATSKDGLPPIDELENAPVEVLVEVLGFPVDAAHEFVKMPRARKRRIIAESRALISMTHEQRQEALAKLRKAWPKGPMPTFSTEDVGPEDLLPEGCCFPLSRNFRDPATGMTLDWETDAASLQIARKSFPRRGYASPAMQKAALGAISCEVACKAPEIEPEQGARRVDACRAESGAPSRDQMSGMIMARGQIRPEDVTAYFNHELRSRICLLDGDLHARLAQERLEEADFRGEKFKYRGLRHGGPGGQAVSLSGCFPLLSITKPTVVLAAHKEFLHAGADVVRTNTRHAHSLALAAYGVQQNAYDVNKAAAMLAKKATAEVTKQDKRKPRFVLGVVGPFDGDSVASDRIFAACVEQVRGLVDGGADMLLIEAAPDVRTARIAAQAAVDFFEGAQKKPLPLMVTAHIAVASGHLDSGATLEAFCVGMRHSGALSTGISLSATAGDTASLSNAVGKLAEWSPGWCHVNLGTGTDASPDAFVAALRACSADDPWSFVGGGIGALPSHIAALAKHAPELRPRKLPAPCTDPVLSVSAGEAAAVPRGAGCSLVGRRCSPMGSAKFKQLVDAFKATGDEGQLRLAVEICAEQCSKGADIIELNLDSDAVDGTPSAGMSALGKFVRLCAKDARVAKVPLMLTSCDWATIEAGLREATGKCIVNGICLMLGEEEFLRIARACQAHGAALVVLAIGETGQADSYEEKVRVCQRSYRLLRSRLDFPPQDIIFDCQLTPLGNPDEAASAITFINAVGELRRTCPHASFIAGVGNLSVHLRGVEGLRDALHSVFLRHAIPKGLNIVIAEVGALPRYEDLDVEIRNLCEEVVLNRSVDGDHLSRFSAFAAFRADRALCLPVAPRPWVGAMMRAEGAATAEARETQEGVFGKRRKVTPSEQNEYWRSVRSTVSCASQHVRAECAVPLPCLVRGSASVDTMVADLLAKRAANPGDVLRHLNAELGKRLCVLESDVGQALHRQNLAEAQYRGTLFAQSRAPLKGNQDVLCLTQPQLVQAVHRDSLAAGADVCLTNTFSAISVLQAAYETQSQVYDMNRAAAQIAKQATAEAVGKDRVPRFVAGVLSSARSVVSGATASASGATASWDELLESYGEQVRGLVDGGVDMLAMPGVCDAVSAKAAVYAADRFFERTGRERLPLLVSVQVDETGRVPSGQTLAAFLASIRHARPFAVGVEGSQASSRFPEFCRELASFGGFWTCAYSVDMASGVRQGLESCAQDGLLNFVRAAQVAVSAQVAKGAQPRLLPSPVADPPMKLSGLEVLVVRPQDGLQLVGQRCNMAGSARFKTLVESCRYAKGGGGSWDAAIELAARQLGLGANIIDLNFDFEGVDAAWAMRSFLRARAKHGGAVAAAPCMLSSATWSVIEEGLKNCPGKCIVNAISLAQGEHEFLQLAKACLRHGAAVVILPAEGEGLASNVEGKISACKRCYRLLRSRLDFPAEDIIFDCGLGPVGSFDVEADAALSCLEAIAEVKKSCPGVSLLAGVGNVSASYRGIRQLREALHSVFLQHAIRRGLNFALADAGWLPSYPDLESPTLALCEEVVLNWSEDGEHVARLVEFASFLRGAVADRGLGTTDLALPETALDVAASFAIVPAPIKPSPTYRRPLETLVQATGTINASLFATFGSKAHAADNFHRLAMASGLKRNVLFSSISAYMGQGGAGPVPGASSILDAIAMWERHQGINGQPITVQWGAIGEIGLRRAIYGSRDVFAQFDLGQKLIGPADTQMLERAIMTGISVPEFLGMAYLDQNWQNQLAGLQAGGSGLSGRTTFADI